jgi:protein tyrosine phosphatase (PTP) superfamily phosphohydrolase (DUF442 family)
VRLPWKNPRGNALCLDTADWHAHEANANDPDPHHVSDLSPELACLLILRLCDLNHNSRQTKAGACEAVPKSAQSLPPRALLHFANYFGLRSVYFRPLRWVESQVVGAEERSDMKRHLVGFLLAALPLVVQGCSHCHPRPQPGPCPCPGPGPGPAPMVVAPGAVPPRGAVLPDAPVAPAPPAPVQSKSPDFSQDLSWRAGGAPSVRLYPPEIVEGSDNKKLPPRPEVFENDKPAPKVDLGNPQAPADKQVPVVDKPAPPKVSSFPVGIPQFAQTNDNLASGLRPSLDDGLDWLRDNGYKTVIYLRAPGDNDSADRKQVEQRGMKYFSLEISPQTLSKTLANEFSSLVTEQGNRPVFVYDSDGARAGAMWYLHFRLGQKASDDDARTQARALGLRENRNGLHQEMWDAARKLTQE